MDSQDRARLRTEIETGASAVVAGESGASRKLGSVLAEQNPIDVALVFSDLDEPEHVTVAFDLLPRESQVSVLPESDPRVQALLLMHVGDRDRTELVSELEPDDAADVLEVVEEGARESILSALEADDAREIRELRTWGPETAGGLMTPEFLAVGSDLTEGAVIEAIRRNRDVETINNIYVTDEERLVGVFSVRELLLADPGQRVSALQTTDVFSVLPDDDREEVVRVMETYHLSTIPVVDDAGRMLGIVTSDDAMTALEEEASEDVMTIAGATGAFPTRQTVLERVRARIPWLGVTLLGVMLSAVVIQGMGELMGHEEAVSAVAWFLPVVAGLAGNVAMQSAAVMVRGFATGEIARERIGRLIGEEIVVGLLVGLLCGSAAAVVALIMGAPGALPIGVGISITAATTIAGGSGTVIPSLCERMGIDPAISAGPFITTLNDILGFAIYMAVALPLVAPGASLPQ